MSASTIQVTGMTGTASSSWHLRTLLRTGVLGGVISIYLCLVGIVPVFADRALIVGVIELGQAALLIAFGAVGYLAARDQVGVSRVRAVVAGTAVGAISGTFLTGLVLVGSVVDLRAVFLNASPELYALLTNGQGTSWAWFPIVVGAITGGLAGVVAGLPAGLRSMVLCEPGIAGLLRPLRRAAANTHARDPAGRSGPLPARRGRPDRARRDHRVLRDHGDHRRRPEDEAEAARERAAEGPASPGHRSGGDPAPRRGPALPARDGLVLRAGHRHRGPVHPAGPRPEHHPGPGRPAGPGLRRVLCGRCVHRRPADLARRVRPRPADVLAGGPVRGHLRDGLRDLPRPADPADPRRLPRDRHPGLRRDHPHPRRDRTCSRGTWADRRGS